MSAVTHKSGNCFAKIDDTAAAQTDKNVVMGFLGNFGAFQDLFDRRLGLTAIKYLIFESVIIERCCSFFQMPYLVDRWIGDDEYILAPESFSDFPKLL
jgi:hypothetical protein